MQNTQYYYYSISRLCIVSIQYAQQVLVCTSQYEYCTIVLDTYYAYVLQYVVHSSTLESMLSLSRALCILRATLVVAMHATSTLARVLVLSMETSVEVWMVDLWILYTTLDYESYQYYSISSSSTRVCYDYGYYLTVCAYYKLVCAIMLRPIPRGR